MIIDIQAKQQIYLSILLEYICFIDLENENLDYVYRFPVVRGVQAKKEYYIAMVPLKMISKLFPDEEGFIPPEYRAQRRLNAARVPVISRYILDNKESYVFSALAASIDGEFIFKADQENHDVGVLEVSMDATFLINDGQHRKAAIIEALNEDPSIGDETISIVFFEDRGLARSQQIFTDLNKNAVKTSNSISELYDSRDELAVLTRQVISNIEFLNHYTDKEKDILGKYSSNLFTLNTFYLANKAIVGRHSLTDEVKEFIQVFWQEVTDHMVQWNELQRKEITKVDLRENYLSTQGIVIQALGRVGNYFLENSTLNCSDYLGHLQQINWRRSDPIWKLRAINPRGRIITNKSAAILIANVIKTKMGLELNETEQQQEKNIQATQ